MASKGGFESHLELGFFSEFPFDVKKTLSCCYFKDSLGWLDGCISDMP